MDEPAGTSTGLKLETAVLPPARRKVISKSAQVGTPSRRGNQVPAIDEPDHVLRRVRFGTGSRASRDEQLNLGKGQREVSRLVHTHVDERDSYVSEARGPGQE